MSSDLAVSSPLSVGGIISNTFRVYRAHFLRFVLVTGIFVIPANLISTLSGESYTLYDILAGLLQVWASLAIASLAIRALQGGEANTKDSLKEAGSRLGVLIAVSLLQVFLALLMVAPGIVLVLLWQQAPAVGVLLALVGVLLLVYAGLRWTVTTPAILVDRKGVVDTLRMSWRLTHGHLWHCIGLGLLVGLILSLAGVPIGIAGLVGGKAEVVMQYAVNILIWPIDVIAIVVLYFDLRARQAAIVVSDAELAPAIDVPAA